MKQTIKKLTGTLVYVMVDKPATCWDADKGKEWKAGVVLTDEDLVDAFDEAYPKQTAKKVKTAEFEETYKCSPPEDAGKNVWVITLKKNVKLANGEPVPDKYRPRVYEKQGASRVDITFSKLVGNGSVGSISIDHYEGEKGDIARLQNILVTDLVEYEGGNYESGSEFDEDDDTPAKPEPKKEAKPAAKSTAKPKKEAKAEPDQDDPFA